MKKQFTILLSLIFVLALSIPIMADATSGACSYHSGVNCSRGWQADGTVYCNDNWTGSMVYYDFMLMCEDEKFAPECVDYIRGKDEYLKKINGLLDDARMKIAYTDTSNPYVAQRWENYLDYLYTLRDRQISRYNDIARICTNDIKKKQQQYLDLQKIQLSCSEGTILSGNICISHTDNCKNYYGQNVYGVKGDNSNSSCSCLSGYNWSSDQTACVKNETITSPEIKGVSDNNLIPEGAIIKTADNPDIYIVKYVGAKKFKRLILSPSVFNNYGHLKWENVMDVDKSIVDSFTTSDLVRAVGDDKVYKLSASGDTGQKRMIKNSAVLTKFGLDADSIYEINSFDRESYIAGLDLE